MSKLLNFENVVKLIGLAITATSLYFALDKRLSLMEQKLDYMVDTYRNKEIEAKLVVADLKDVDKEQAKELAELKERLIKICAVLPKRWYGKIEGDDK